MASANGSSRWPRGADRGGLKDRCSSATRMLRHDGDAPRLVCCAHEIGTGTGVREQLDDGHRRGHLGLDGVVLAPLARRALLGIPQPIVPVHHQRLGDESIPPLEHRARCPVDPDQLPVLDEELQVLVEEQARPSPSVIASNCALSRSGWYRSSSSHWQTMSPQASATEMLRRRPSVDDESSTPTTRMSDLSARPYGRSPRGDTAHGPPSRSPSLVRIRLIQVVPHRPLEQAEPACGDGEATDQRQLRRRTLWVFERRRHVAAMEKTPSISLKTMSVPV